MYERILSRAEIKAKAKAAMRAQRSNAIINYLLYSLVVLACTFVLNAVSGSSAVFEKIISMIVSGGSIQIENLLRLILASITASLLITAVNLFLELVAYPILQLGTQFNAVRLYRQDRPMRLGNIFVGFTNRMGRSFCGLLWMELWLVIWGLIPIAGPIIVLVKSLAYRMTPYILVEHPEIDARSALKESIRMTNGHKADLFVLDLSFIGWTILSALTFGLLFIFYVGPYILITSAGFYTEYEKMTIGSGVGLDKGATAARTDPSTARCAHCGAPLYAGSTVCGHCGHNSAATATTYCIKCGNPIPGGGEICMDCRRGAKSEVHTESAYGGEYRGSGAAEPGSAAPGKMKPSNWHSKPESSTQNSDSTSGSFSPPEL